ncbi:hypothetical protein DYB31_002966 [Aphanomyces astaci]|uniref:Uncharacterized protein n=1 Tax=Aphanomyces astaci TaxID=112090 RepID=A0A397F6T4_APHAT|nr:hypothetical protein DYB31_002966 [Aphanomyces astaci]
MGQVVPNRVVGLANLTLTPSSLTKAVQRQADLVLRKSATRGNVRELLPGQTVVLDTARTFETQQHDCMLDPMLFNVMHNCFALVRITAVARQYTRYFAALFTKSVFKTKDITSACTGTSYDNNNI